MGSRSTNFKLKEVEHKVKCFLEIKKELKYNKHIYLHYIQNRVYRFLVQNKGKVKKNHFKTSKIVLVGVVGLGQLLLVT